MTPPPDDDLSHLPPEVAGRIRENLAFLHHHLDAIPWRTLERRLPLVDAIAAVSVDVAFLVHIQAHEIRRVQRARRAAWVVVAVALAASLLSLVRG